MSASGTAYNKATRQTIRYGKAGPSIIEWNDTKDPHCWVAAVGNQAGSYDLQSPIVRFWSADGCLKIATEDGDVWTVQYVGQPLIYSFSSVEPFWVTPEH